MKNLNKLINQFNKPDTFLIVSGWPYDEEKLGYVYDGMARYAKRTISALVLKKNLKFIILVEKNNGDKPKLFCQGRILVLPVFDKKRPSLFPVVLKWLLRLKAIKKVYVHSEFCITGGLKTFVLLLPFLSLIRLTGRRIVFFAHNVVTSFDSLAPHFNLKKGDFKLWLFNVGLKYYYRTLGFTVDKIVVLDQVIASRLYNFVSSKKVILSPHWIAKVKKDISKTKAREKLGVKPDEKIILYFGFCTWYKGADWIINNIRKQRVKRKDNIRLIMVGGEAYSLKDKTYYQRYYQNLLAKARRSNKISITGFVPEKSISTYFQAADLVVFPYRGLIGASGALSYTLAFKKPFLLSKKMADILDNREVEEILSLQGLEKKDLFFGLNQRGWQKILSVLKTPRQLKRLRLFSYSWANQRSEDKSLSREYNLIYQMEKSVDFSGLENKLLPAIRFSY